MNRFKFIFLVMFLATSASAAPGSGGSGFIGDMSLIGGAGTTANDDKTIPSVNLAFGEFALEGGYKFGWIAPVIQASYRYVGQTTDPDSAKSINMAGSGYLAGAGLLFSFSRLNISAVYDLTGSYDLQKSSSSGAKVTYKAASGFHANFRYLWTPSWEFVVGFSQIKFKEKVVGSTTTDISTNPVTQTLYGAGVGYRF